jgi:hypothetical protein
VSWVFQLNQQMKESWVSRPGLEPPFGHAEEVSLAALARRTNLDLEQALAELSARDLRHGGAQDTLERIARANDSTPMAIWQHIRQFERQPPQPGSVMTAVEVETRYAGSGIGRKTVAEVARAVRLDPKLAHRRLRDAGLASQDDEQLKTLAERHALNPMDLLKVMLVPGHRPMDQPGHSGG